VPPIITRKVDISKTVTKSKLRRLLLQEKCNAFMFSVFNRNAIPFYRFITTFCMDDTKFAFRSLYPIAIKLRKKCPQNEKMGYVVERMFFSFWGYKEILT
jgi:hypothetical protein